MPLSNVPCAFLGNRAKALRAQAEEQDASVAGDVSGIGSFRMS